MNSEHSTASNSNGQIHCNVQTEPFEKDKEYTRHIYAHKTGGVHLNVLKDQDTKAVMLSVLKQVGSKFAHGDFNLLNISKPVQLTKPISFLECLCNEYLYYSAYLTMAAQTRDPLTRMHCIATAIIAGMHVNHTIFLAKVPMDSLLGETLQLEKEDGTKFYAELIDTSPPTCLINIYGPNNLFKVTGYIKVIVKMHPTMTSINADAIGKRKITFYDGKVFELATYPQTHIEGVLNGDRVINHFGQYQIHAKQDLLIATVNFPYEVQPEGKMQKMTKKLSSLIWTAEEKAYKDIFEAQIHKKLNIDNDEELFPLSNGKGSWLSYASFDGNVLWRIDDKISAWMANSTEVVLESDGTKKLDGLLIKQNQLNEAQEIRNKLEEQYKRDQKLRKKHKK